MKLSELLGVLSIQVPVEKNREIRNISFHSGDVRQGDLFVAISGFVSDGHRYIQDALDAGAVAVIGEKEIQSLPVPYFRVSNARLALGKMASEFYGNPSSNHIVIGITGTNGKTTTAHMVRHIIEYTGHSCSLFGTVECYVNGKSFLSKMTTYDAVQIQRWIAQSNDENVVIEASSHGLAQHRLDGVSFDFALFTNLSHEHLDFHQTLEQYFKSKEKLFFLLKSGGEAIVNTNTDWGRKLRDNLVQRNIRVSTVGPHPEDTLQVTDVENVSTPTIRFKEHGVQHLLHLPIPGHYNVWNAMGAVLLARRRGIPYDTIAEAVASFPGVPGRFQKFEHPSGAVIVVDYAHTPDGLIQCFETVRAMTPKRIIHIFGFRGKKDDSKWDFMLNISTRYSDKTILTFDDRNGVPGEKILGKYQNYSGRCEIIEDRTMAISYAWGIVENGDWILITGKGPEPYTEPFRLLTSSDIETVCLLKEGE